jgi:hypothetical protein
MYAAVTKFLRINRFLLLLLVIKYYRFFVRDCLKLTEQRVKVQNIGSHIVFVVSYKSS